MLTISIVNPIVTRYAGCASVLLHTAFHEHPYTTEPKSKLIKANSTKMQEATQPPTAKSIYRLSTVNSRTII